MGIRDIVLILLLVGGLPFAVRNVFFGVTVYAWLGLMNPHRLTWGAASHFSWAQLYAIAVLIGLVLWRDGDLRSSLKGFRWALLYLMWTVVTTAFALEPAWATSRLGEALKIYVMAFVTTMLLTTERRVRVFALVATGSIAFYGIKGGAFTLLTGGGSRVWGPPGSVIMDNNQLAVALTMTVPLLFWVYRLVERRLLKMMTVASMLLVLVAIIGTHSRGAFLAVCAMGFFLFMKSDKKVGLALVIGLAVAVTLSVMPAEYWERIGSITNYQHDESAQGRLNSWATAINVANDRITGGGFNYHSVRSFAKYAPDPSVVFAAHSIYFQALGEHGWLGLALYLAVLGSAWTQCGGAVRLLRGHSELREVALLASMIKVSLIGFMVGGAFVNIGYWDFPLYLLALAIAARRLAEAQVQTSSRARVGVHGRPALGQRV